MQKKPNETIGKIQEALNLMRNQKFEVMPQQFSDVL